MWCLFFQHNLVVKFHEGGHPLIRGSSTRLFGFITQGTVGKDYR